jgi:hypothetical protein
MTERAAIRPDVRLDDGPMVPVTCEACRARVEVRKSSWEQTSIQWSAAATSACHERGLVGATADGIGFAGCSALTASIRKAAVDGSLPVQIEDPLLLNDDPDGHGGAHHEPLPW